MDASGRSPGPVGEMVRESNLEFRDGTDHMFTQLAENQVPVLILSAGVGDLVTTSASFAQISVWLRHNSK